MDKTRKKSVPKRDEALAATARSVLDRVGEVVDRRSVAHSNRRAVSPDPHIERMTLIDERVANDRSAARTAARMRSRSSGAAFGRPAESVRSGDEVLAAAHRSLNVTTAPLAALE